MSGFRGRLGELVSICSFDLLVSSRFHPKVLSSLVNGKPGKPVPKKLHFSNARVITRCAVITVRGGAQIQRGLVQVIVP